MVKVRVNRLVDGDIITISGFLSKDMDKNVKVIESDEKILIIIKK
jgi:hypothetical protein